MAWADILVECGALRAIVWATRPCGDHAANNRLHDQRFRSETMGLFDGISSMISNAASGGEGAPLAEQLMGVLQQHGIDGASGLVAHLQQSGLGEHIASWTGSGENLPISSDQIESALGSPIVASLAAKFGIDPSQVNALLSQHLPGIVTQAAASDDETPTA
jgi:uncharacterized protein YidB (DUF937 family)